ncbi:MAG: flavodoxin domain-containing protein [Actinomycetia bacterium]|nr:flavodoxin domain-containing protein [Actinomycetes bacterium]
MQKVLVVYESMFGNTHDVAEAVATGLRSSVDVTLVDVGDAPLEIPDEIDLVVVGGPTHAFGMSRPSTRQSAVEQGADPQAAEHIGLREWIAGVVTHEGLPTAAFDTKVAKPHLPGSAAKAAERKLRHRGFKKLADPESFLVAGTTGNLLDGELERARAWGESLAVA